MKEWSGAGVIFGATGGVMEAALRSAHYLVTGRNPDPDAFKIVRSPSFETGVVEAEVQIGDATIRAAVVSGLGNVRKLLEAIEHGEVHYELLWKLWLVREDASVEAASRSTTAKSLHTHAVQTSISLTRTLRSDSPMRTRML